MTRYVWPILIGSLAGPLALEIKTAGGSDVIQGYDVATERSVIAAKLPTPAANTAALTLDGSSM